MNMAITMLDKQSIMVATFARGETDCQFPDSVLYWPFPILQAQQCLKSDLYNNIIYTYSVYTLSTSSKCHIKQQLYKHMPKDQNILGLLSHKKYMCIQTMYIIKESNINCTLQYLVHTGIGPLLEERYSSFYDQLKFIYQIKLNMQKSIK